MIIALMPLVAAVALAGFILTGLRPGARRSFSTTWIRDLNAPITDELVREVEVTRWRQNVGGLSGLLVGLIIVVPVNLGVDFSSEQSLTLNMAVWIAPLVLYLLGRGFVGAAFAFRTVRGSVRVAPAQAPRLTDYVNATGLLIVRILLALLLISSLIATQVPGWIGADSTPIELAYRWGSFFAIAVLWGGVEIMGRRLVDQPLPSADATELFWRDQLRGDHVRDLYRMLPMLGILMPMVIAQALPRFYGSVAASTGPALVLVCRIALVGLTLAAQSTLIRKPSGERSEAVLNAARGAGQAV